MDARDAMAFPGAPSHYYLQRGGGFGSAAAAASAMHAPPGLRPMSNPHIAPSQPNAAFSMGGESRHVDFGQMVVVAASSPGAQPPPTETELVVVKKKRGRPRKYAPDGQVSLGLSPLPPANSKPKSSSGTDPQMPKGRRGRPRGTGRKQRLANLGEWMNNSAGHAFAPHVISVEVGEDIVSKVLLFSQQRPRAVCILSGTGTVSSITLRQPASSSPSVTFEGRFEILCLSGSYLVNEEGGVKSRTGGISASLSSPEGHMIGGGMAMLVAASPVQVVACSFVYGGGAKTEAEQRVEPNEKDGYSGTPASAPPALSTRNFGASAMHGWAAHSGHGRGSRQLDSRNPHHDIDLTHG